MPETGWTEVFKICENYDLVVHVGSGLDFYVEKFLDRISESSSCKIVSTEFYQPGNLIQFVAETCRYV